MSYEHFAYLYDQLMEDAPYNEWVDFVKNKITKYGQSGKRMLDLACGTGELSIRFAKEGFDVTGVDLSSDMLSVAQAKAEREKLAIPFYQQDMAELEGLGTFDVIGIFCDSLNYLTAEEKVIKTIVNAYKHLKKDGLLFFDVHSLFKINHTFLNQNFTLNGDDLAYIWNSFPGEESNSVEHELSFFVLDECTGKYDRFDELHEQRTFSVDTYIQWIKQAGFDFLEVSADFDVENKPLQTQSERIFFIARKND